MDIYLPKRISIFQNVIDCPHCIFWEGHKKFFPILFDVNFERFFFQIFSLWVNFININKNAPSEII